VIIKIKNIKIGYKYPPIIIAEISGNHNGDKKKFLELIKSACLNGADLIKIQTYEPKDITLKGKTNQFYIKKGIWKNKHLWSLYKKACTPLSWHKDAFKNKLPFRYYTLKEYCRLQTVPENYFTDIVSESQAKKMLGNGWTVDVIAHILNFIKTRQHETKI
jgi:site-specific DNA-cytosine methylase